MKYIVLILLLLSYNLYCQNKDPDPLKFSNSEETNENLGKLLNTPDKFIRGWQWTVDLKLSDPRALNMNAGGSWSSHFLNTQNNIYVDKNIYDVVEEVNYSYITDYNLHSNEINAFSTFNDMPLRVYVFRN